MMADHDEENDYEFDNAEDWDIPAPRQRAKAPVAHRQSAPRQTVHQELKEQLITILPDDPSTFHEASEVAERSNQAPKSARATHRAASDRPQTFNDRNGETNEEEIPIKYGAFAVPPLKTFEQQYQFPLPEANYGGFPFDGPDDEFSGMLGSSFTGSSGISVSNTRTNVPASHAPGPIVDTSSTDGGEYTASEAPDRTASDSEVLDGSDDYRAGFKFSHEADVRERQGGNPDGRFHLDTNRHHDFDRRFFGPRENNLDHIAKRTGTHLSMPRDAFDPVIEMWGSPEQIKAAKQFLMELTHLVNEEIDREKPRIYWAKVRAGISARRQMYLEEQAKKAVIRRAFRRPPSDGSQFVAVGIFVWPNREISPQVTLGMNLEHLDSIRFEHEVHIIWSRKKQLFRVLGSDSENVDKAIDRIYGCFCEIAAKNRKPNRMILVEPPSFRIKGVKVRMNEEHDLRNRQVIFSKTGPTGIQLSLVGPAPSTRFRQMWEEQSIIIAYANDAYMRRTIRQGLLDVAYYRGYVKLKFHIGKLVLFGYKKSSDDEYDLLDYIREARESQSDGEVIRYLGSRDLGVTDEEVAEAAISRMRGAPDTFTPVDMNEDLHLQDLSEEALEPQISATFELKMFDGTGRNVKIRLEVSFVREPNTEKYTISEYRWLMSPIYGSRASGRHVMNRRSPVDITVQDLESELAYHMELSTWQVVPDTDIYPIFDEFLRHCSVEVIPDERYRDDAGHALGNDDEPRMIKRVTFANLPGLNVNQLTQKTKYRFWHSGCTYRYEITKYEYLPTDEILDLYPDSVQISFKGLRAPPDVRWGAAMDNSNWEVELRQQTSVRIGMRGDWNTDVDSFFSPTHCKPIDDTNPDWRDDDGFEECIFRAKDFMVFLRKVQTGVAIAKATATARDREAQVDNESTYGGPEEYDM